VQILVAVAVIQSSEDRCWWLKTGVEQVSLPTAVAHGSVDRKPCGNATALSNERNWNGEQAAGINIPSLRAHNCGSCIPMVTGVFDKCLGWARQSASPVGASLPVRQLE